MGIFSHEIAPGRYEFRLEAEDLNQENAVEFFHLNPDYDDEERLEQIASPGQRVYRLNFHQLPARLEGDLAIMAAGKAFPAQLKKKDHRKVEELLAKNPQKVWIRVWGGQCRLFLCDHDYRNRYYPAEDRNEKYRAALVIEM